MEQEKEFIHIGIKHTRVDESGGVGSSSAAASSRGEFHYVLDQNDYASAIKPVSVPELMKAKDEDMLVGLLLSCFLTLLGAVAWLLQTRMEIAVYVSALQRKMHAPRAIDLRRLNRVIRWAQRNPKGLTYKRLPEPRVLLAVGDSAFQAPTEEEIVAGKDPLVMRGYILAWAHRIDHNSSESIGGGTGSSGAAADRKVMAGVKIGRRRYLLQLLDYTAGKQNHVCRGVWSSELHNQCDMVEMGSIIAGFTMECCHGPQTGEALKNAITNGSAPMKMEALTDSYSIFSYLAVAHLKLPAEKGTYFHLAYLREKLVSQLLKSYNWTDTRDMCCDGLTKGAIDRTSLSKIMDGTYDLQHPVHEYIEPTQQDCGLVLYETSMLNVMD